MRAMVLEAPGRPLREAELPEPKPRKGELLLRVHACGVCRVALFTIDVQRLAEFYEQVLGTPVASRSESHASFDLDGTTLFIHMAGGENPDGAPNGDHVAFALRTATNPVSRQSRRE